MLKLKIAEGVQINKKQEYQGKELLIIAPFGLLALFTPFSYLPAYFCFLKPL
jgi:hypothetical protein